MGGFSDDSTVSGTRMNVNCVDLDDDTITSLREHHDRCLMAAAERKLIVGQLPLSGKPSDMTRPWAPNPGDEAIRWSSNGSPTPRN